MNRDAAIKERYAVLRPLLDERSRRLVAAAESQVIGRSGITAVSKATGVSRRVIRRGMAELKAPAILPAGRVRRPGGGRKKAATQDPALKGHLQELLESTTRGDPEAPLRWTCKSVRNLTAELPQQQHSVSHQVVADLLHELGYRLQANRQTRQGASPPDRNAQFEHLNAKVKRYLGSQDPVISVDTTKQELVGDCNNGGRELRPKGDPEKVRVHDFLNKEWGRATPDGSYDIGRNAGWVSVGVDHDTAEFAVASIRRWWRSMGVATYPRAQRLLLTADSGGSNGAGGRLWKLELPKLADETGLRIAVCHVPPATSKWNQSEHRLFSFISPNGRGKPLISLAVIVNLIAATTTSKGLQVHSELDQPLYQSGSKVADAGLAQVNLKRDNFHGDWNYQIIPRKARL